MKVLELFAGTRSVSRAFERSNGHETYCVEFDTKHKNIDWYVDIDQISAQALVDRFGVPDVVWASPPCQSYSVAAIGHHRQKEKDGTLSPKTDFARASDRLLVHTLEIIHDLQVMNPNIIYFIENPMAGMRKMKCMQDIPRYLITYCQYGDTRMKPTDIWTNHPDPQFKPACHYGDSCHVKAPRGSRCGTQAIKGAKDRSRIPDQFCDHIVELCENYRPTDCGLPLIPLKSSQRDLTQY